jgi:hypothetical protein
MSICIANKRDGTPCTLSAQPGNEYCWAHDPANAEQRAKAASKAGRSKTPNAEIAEVKALLRTYMDDVIDGSLEKGRGSVAATLAGVLCRYIEVERRVKETEELAAEVEELKALVEGRSRGWRA